MGGYDIRGTQQGEQMHSCSGQPRPMIRLDGSSTQRPFAYVYLSFRYTNTYKHVTISRSELTIWDIAIIWASESCQAHRAILALNTHTVHTIGKLANLSPKCTPTTRVTPHNPRSEGVVHKSYTLHLYPRDSLSLALCLYNITRSYIFS